MLILMLLISINAGTDDDIPADACVPADAAADFHADDAPDFANDPAAYDADTYADAGFPADAAYAAACVAANDPAAANSADADSADAETIVDNAADIDTPVAYYADAGAEAPVDALTAVNDAVPADT